MLVALAIVVAAGSYAAAERRAIVQSLLIDALAEAGLPAPRLTVEAVDWDRLLLSGISIGGGRALSAAGVELRYRPLQLLHRRLDVVRITGLALTARLAAGGLTLGPDGLPLPAGGGRASRWSAGAITLDRARVALGGDLAGEIGVDGALHDRGGGNYRGRFTLAGRLAMPPMRAIPLAGTLTLSASAAGVQNAELTLTSGALPAGVLGGVLGGVPGSGKGGKGEVHLLLAPTAARFRIAIDTAEGRLAAEGELARNPGAGWNAARGEANLELAVAGAAIPGTALTVGAEGRLRLALADGELSVRASQPLLLSARSPGARVGLRIPPAAEPFLRMALAAAQPRQLHLRLAAAELDLSGQRLALDGGDAELRLGEGTIFTLRSLRIRPLAEPAWLSPLDLAGEALLAAGALRFAGKAKAAAGAALAVTGRADLGAATGEASLTLSPLSFRPGGLQPRDLVPAIAPWITAAAGRISAGGAVRWAAGRLTSDLAVHLDDLSLTAAGVRVQGISGEVQFSRLWPPATPPGQRLRVARIDAGLPMTDLDVRFRLERGRRIAIAEAGLDLLGGRVRSKGAVLGLRPMRFRGTLEAIHLSMQAAIDLAGLGDVSAEGRLSGTVPITLSAREMRIDRGLLVADGEGVIRYHPQRPPAALRGGGEGVGLMLAALRNFHYRELSLSLDGETGKGWRSVVRVKGKNPDFLDGQPFEFNFNLSGDLEQVIRSGIFGYTLSDRLRDELLKKGRGAAGR